MKRYDSHGDEVRQVKLFDGYVISESGRVYSTKRNEGFGCAWKMYDFDKYHKELKTTVGQVYPKVNLRFEGRNNNLDIHRLVAKAFIPNPNNLPCVCHRDDNPMNSHVSNLFWGSHQDNVDDCERKGRAVKVKLTVSDVLAIRRSRQSIDVLAAKYGVHNSTVRRVIKRKSWRRL